MLKTNYNNTCSKRLLSRRQEKQHVIRNMDTPLFFLSKKDYQY